MLDRLQKRLEEIAGLQYVKVEGGLIGTVAADGEASPSELVKIGRAHEYGIGVPRRPWLSLAVERHRKSWTPYLAQAIKRKAEGDSQASTNALRVLGVKMVGDIGMTIETGPFLPNAQATIDAKTKRGKLTARRRALAQQDPAQDMGEARPLIDTGQLVQSIRATVEGPGIPREVIG